jgi:hypothetical protein
MKRLRTVVPMLAAGLLLASQAGAASQVWAQWGCTTSKVIL